MTKLPKVILTKTSKTVQKIYILKIFTFLSLFILPCMNIVIPFLHTESIYMQTLIYTTGLEQKKLGYRNKRK